MSAQNSPDFPASGRLSRYRAMADHARQEANRTTGDARESYLFIAEQWDRLAELSQSQRPTTSFG